jgi:hypothetical protein
VDPLSKVAERRIQEAVERGEFERYAGKGEPLPPEDDLANVPEDLRAGYRLLKSHGFVPAELEARRALVRLDDLIAACAEPAARGALEERRRRQTLELALLLERRGVPHAAIELLVARRSGQSSA